MVSHIENPGNFHVRYMMEHKSAHRLTQKINTFCTEESSLFTFSDEIKTGMCKHLTGFSVVDSVCIIRRFGNVWLIYRVCLFVCMCVHGQTLCSLSGGRWIRGVEEKWPSSFRRGVSKMFLNASLPKSPGCVFSSWTMASPRDWQSQGENKRYMFKLGRKEFVMIKRTQWASFIKRSYTRKLLTYAYVSDY